MIYVCVATRDHAKTVGLLLWKLRKVFDEFPREYHMLVADDGSSDRTREVLETYQRALPMTLLPSGGAGGDAATLERLLNDALGRTDRPKRDCVATLPADFSVSPAVLPELVKRFESGADVVVGEAAPERWRSRILRRLTPWLLRPGLHVPGVRDFTSGTCLIRLVTLKNCYRDRPDRLLELDGVSAYAELLGRTAASARQIATVPLPSDPVPDGAALDRGVVGLALDLYRTGRRLRLPAPSAPVQRGVPS